MKQQKPIIHGRDHLPSGADPIPGLLLESLGSFSDWVLSLSGVWAYWPLQDASGDATDLGPMNADLDPVGTPAYHATGPNSDDLPYAVRLTGSGAAAGIADDSFFDTADVLGAGDYPEWTAMAWIKPDSAASSSWDLPILGTWDVFRTGWMLYLLATTRQLVFLSGNGSTTSPLIGPAVTMDAWSLVAVTRDASNVRLYVDGSEVASGSLGVYASNHHGIRLGALDYQGASPDAFFFYGSIAGALFVDRALTGGEILDGYTAATSSGGGGVMSVTAGDSSVTVGGTAADPTVAVATGGVGPAQLAATAVSAGTYGDATHVGRFTVDADGRLTAASSVAISAGASLQWEDV